MATVTTQNEILTVSEGTRLADALSLPLACGGHGKCGKCRVFAQGALSPVTDAEKQHLAPDELASGIRLACHTYVLGDCRVKLQKEHSIISVEGDALPTAPRGTPAFKQYGVALDLGTTTIAATLFDVNGNALAQGGARNPQDAWGADVISRIQAATEGKADQLALAVRRGINDLISSLATAAGVSQNDIDGAVITGNTAMLTLLTQRSALPLARAPFCAEELFGESLTADKLGINSIRAEAKIYLPPCISAFVGADMTCTILASEITENSKPALIADIGTNGEMALWNGSTGQVCSTAAGPAFEGATIKMGMLGESGAIHRVTLVNGVLSAQAIGNAAPRGICGGGIVDAVACLLDVGELDPSGLLDDAPATIAAPVVLTQEDIRMVQLAKGAIYGGITTLLDAAGVSSAQLDRFYIAGGFGSRLNIHNAARIGLIPSALTGKARAIGNAALHGASMLLLDTALQKKAAEICRLFSVLDLAQSSAFSTNYINGMSFPQ